MFWDHGTQKREREKKLMKKEMEEENTGSYRSHTICCGRYIDRDLQGEWGVDQKSCPSLLRVLVIVSLSIGPYIVTQPRL